MASSTAITVGCVTCRVRQELSLADLASPEAPGRAFLVRHGDCLTTLELPDRAPIAGVLALTA